MSGSALKENLKQLFAECDTDKNGSLGREEFRDLCNKIGLSEQVANETFDRLDVDKNDRITFDEFSAGFDQYKQTSSKPSSPQLSTGSRLSTPTTDLSSPQLSPTSSPQPGKQQDSHPSPSTAHRSLRTLNTSPLKRHPAGPVSSLARKNVSPLGMISLGSTGSNGSNPATGRSISSGADASSTDFNSSAESASLFGIGAPQETKDSSVVVYSSDNIGDYEQAGGSGQFSSIISSNGSFNQLRNMQDLLECVQQLQSENQTLSQIFFKDKREREEYISQLGEEFDIQLKEVEERANRRAKEELESEKKRLREMMQAERETLQHHYQTIEKMSHIIKSANGKLDDGEGIDKVRSKLEDTFLENRQLKKSLLDTKTDVAMIWKEMEKLKSQYEQKLSSAYQRNDETRNECDHIKQQLNLMKDSNRKLQDASDVITNYITDKVEPVINNANGEDELAHSSSSNKLNASNTGPDRFSTGGSQSSSRRGSILSQYLNDNQKSSDSQNSNISSEEMKASSSPRMRLKNQHPRSPTSKTANLTGSLYIQVPSNLPTLVDLETSSNETETNQEKDAQENVNEGGEIKESCFLRKEVNFSCDKQTASNSVISSSIKEEQESSFHCQPSIAKQQQESTKFNQEPCLSRSTSSNSSRFAKLGFGRRSTITQKAKHSETDAKLSKNKSVNSDQSDDPIIEPSDGPSRATFDIILVGDSFVGKSSFAARFMEGTFVQGLISNCSIDFKTKSYKIDGTNYTVNLWDTAGQERFRSITASYFRKADGIVLMYDVTDKRSYLNVRNWMSTISDTASENVAVLLVGNKIDLRHKNNEDACVPTNEGLRLAKEYDIVFLETSVKTGLNLVSSMGKLIRLIAKNNVPVEEDKDRIKLNDKSRSFACMPKNC